MSVGKFKKTEIISSIFSNDNIISLEINHKKKNYKKKKHVEAAQLNNQWITEKDEEEIKKYLEKNESTMIWKLWDAAKQFWVKFVAILNLSSRNKKKSQVNGLTLHLNCFMWFFVYI